MNTIEFKAVLVANQYMRDLIDNFAKKVGAETFEEAEEVLKKTIADHMDLAQKGHDIIKQQSLEISSLKREIEYLKAQLAQVQILKEGDEMSHGALADRPTPRPHLNYYETDER